MAMISSTIEYIVYGVLAAIFVLQVFKTWHINAQHLSQGVPKQHQYKFKQVAILQYRALNLNNYLPP
jgi:NNP family nitrate/nitrite transporter-like MFS transporter